MIQEVEREAPTTRHALERFPADTLSWKLHPTSMSLGQIAHHVALSFGGIAEMFLPDNVRPVPTPGVDLEMPEFGDTPPPRALASWSDPRRERGESQRVAV